ncbi:hypothetical protein [Micromonospora tarensis]|uniref:Uncharacterized protein n=1 Tax=Micromonospora tarensis TaxID=2806100 RepID=A0ABS1YCF1_9ACTN|nr:hypothetical protein [Micromonospora tarensis]MBM0275090.1 hypothetical protein [Micromonospora tarensis]
MATLTLDRVWINRLDTGEAVAAYSGRDRPQTYQADGDVETFAGGRQRAVTIEGEQGTVSLTLRQVPLATVVLLRSWKGLPVQVRDHRGQSWAGVFFTVTPSELTETNWYDVAITVRTVTVAEGV